MTKQKLELKFIVAKGTKNTVVYTELVDDPTQEVAVPSLYLRREAAKLLGNPGALVVTIEAGD